MSERPFMQLYVSDFVGDTLSLSTEHIGAYLLLLIALWNADGSLEDDADILATTTRLPLDRWLVVWSRLSKYFVVSGGRVTHNRLTKELERFASKSAARAEAGSRGGKAKALKDKNTGLAIATSLPQHLPETRIKDARTRSGPTEELVVVAPGTSDFDCLKRARRAAGKNLIIGKSGSATVTRAELEQARAGLVH